MAATGTSVELDGHLITLTNLDKPLYPNGFTKAEVIQHYLAVADVMLPHLARRCVTRVRFPDGSMGPSFYEKNAPGGSPDWLRTFTVDASSTLIAYPLIDSAAALVLMAQYAALELHVPQWQAPTPAVQPFSLGDDTLADMLMVDLDPGEGTTMVDTAEAALIVATRLAVDGLLPHVKTTGSKGLQVQAAISPTGARRVVSYLRRIGAELMASHPNRFLLTQNRAARTGLTLIDVLQNLAVRNTIAPYSLRGRQEPSVSTPVTWDEVAAAAAGAPLVFTAADLPPRLAAHGDLAADLLTPTAASLPDE